jgi:hypothetical protein
MRVSARAFFLVLVFAIGTAAASASADSGANEVGSFFVTANIGLGDYTLSNNFTTYEINDFGIAAGFTLPVVKSYYEMVYKGRVAVHGVEDLLYGDDPSPDDPTYYRNMSTYISSLNEIMVGRRFDLTQALYVRGLLGFGVLVNIIYGNQGPGIAHGSFQFDLTTQWMYRFDGFDLGAQVSLEYVPWDGYFAKADVAYMTIGVAIAR